MMMFGITVLSFFGAGMENSDAAQMVSEWGCNNIVLGIYLTIMLMVGWSSRWACCFQRTDGKLL